MFDIFPDQPAFQYPDLINICFSLAWAFFLASLIAITHKITFLGESYPKNFFQALILGSLVTAMVMMAIGDSLARGLGVFGAMAIIRFRTRIDDPRNVLFLFAALSSGLAVGVFGFAISFAGTIFFCTAAFILHFSPFRSYTHTHKLEITILESSIREHLEQVIKKHCGEFRQTGLLTNRNNELRITYSLSLKNENSKNELMEALKRTEGVIRTSISTLELDNNRL